MPPNSIFVGDVPEQGDLEGARDGSRDLGLELQHIAEVSVIGLRPEVKPGDCIDQLRGNAHGMS